MRQGQQNRRGRNRNNGSRKIQNATSRTYESSGPDVRIRGSASHIAEKYISLARDAMSSGDIILAENLYQHAEHYNRLLMASYETAQNEAHIRSDTSLHEQSGFALSEEIDDGGEAATNAQAPIHMLAQGRQRISPSGRHKSSRPKQDKDEDRAGRRSSGRSSAIRSSKDHESVPQHNYAAELNAGVTETLAKIGGPARSQAEPRRDANTEGHYQSGERQTSDRMGGERRFKSRSSDDRFSAEGANKGRKNENRRPEDRSNIDRSNIDRPNTMRSNGHSRNGQGRNDQNRNDVARNADRQTHEMRTGERNHSERRGGDYSSNERGSSERNVTERAGGRHHTRRRRRRPHGEGQTTHAAPETEGPETVGAEPVTVLKPKIAETSVVEMT